MTPEQFQSRIANVRSSMERFPNDTGIEITSELMVEILAQLGKLTAANARIAELEAKFSASLSRETDARNRCAEYADELDVAKARIDAVPVDALRRLVQSIRNSSVFVQTQDLRDANVWLEAQQVQP